MKLTTFVDVNTEQLARFLYLHKKSTSEDIVITNDPNEYYKGEDKDLIEKIKNMSDNDMIIFLLNKDIVFTEYNIEAIDISTALLSNEDSRVISSVNTDKDICILSYNSMHIQKIIKLWNKE